MKSEIQKPKTVSPPAAPPKEILWEYVLEHEERQKQFEEWQKQLEEYIKFVIPRQMARAIRNILVHPAAIGLPSESAMEREAGLLGLPWEVRVHPVVAPSFDRIIAAWTRESVSSEYSIQRPTERINLQIERLRIAAEALVRDFDTLLARINRHTDLCLASRELRETVRANRDTPFYWALVDLDDCIRACLPEDMSQDMAETLSRCMSQLAVGMSEEEMLAITDALYTAGFRPWRPPRGKALKRRKTADR